MDDAKYVGIIYTNFIWIYVPYRSSSYILKHKDIATFLSTWYARYIELHTDFSRPSPTNIIRNRTSRATQPLVALLLR